MDINSISIDSEILLSYREIFDKNMRLISQRIFITNILLFSSVILLFLNLSATAALVDYFNKIKAICSDLITNHNNHIIFNNGIYEEDLLSNNGDIQPRVPSEVNNNITPDDTPSRIKMNISGINQHGGSTGLDGDVVSHNNSRGGGSGND